MVSNALKLPIGEVNINAKLVKIENKAHFIEFNIQNGGYCRRRSRKIFDKFVQIEEKK
jgi:hypothetical protein